MMPRTGPRTSSGKAISRHNSLRHGLLAAIPVVPGLERQKDWDAHRAGVLASLAPVGHVESVLAERVALQLWRLHRVARYEALAVSSSHETLEKDVEAKRNFWKHPDESAASRLEAATQRLRDQEERLRCLHYFLGLTDADPFTASDTALLLDAVEEVAAIRRGEVSVPFLPADETIERYSAWSAGKLRWLLTAMASGEGRDLTELLSTTLNRAMLQLVYWEQQVAEAAARVEKERTELAAQIEREQRERLLPSERVMDRVTRYEAHLSRELYKAMHELEALQDRRQGRLAPLARLDVTLPENPKLPNEFPT